MAKGGEGMRESVLVIDAGNTTTRFGVARDGALLSTWETSTDPRATADEALCALRAFLGALGEGLARMDAAACGDGAVPARGGAFACGGAPASARGGAPAPAFPSAPLRPRDGIVSSVVPPLTDVWVEAASRLCGRAPLVVGPGLKTGLKMSYSDPGEVGADRVADMVAAKELYGAPAVVVDLGTTTNIEVLDARSAFAGGIIAPGLRLSAEALATAAARLPMVEVKAPASVVGRSTREAMQAGIVMGEVARIDGLIDMVWAEMGCERTTVVLSGRDAGALGALMRHDVVVEPALTLKGLVLLHAANRR
ncbi:MULTISPECIES: type III pantothenate kinase [unclassified Adlercreutzia]|uniref:type III pantothenate kinase n=1 Tax=unclassified Adlercreutzia TaxID=2636013 RepID=UPI001F155984|nr:MULTISPECIES: type III pantothenate kinase [unclassified Adlercreutzia]